MHTLHLINYKFEHRITAVKGVRAALEQFGVSREYSLSQANATIKALRDSNGEPQLVGESDDLSVVQSAEAILESHGCMAIVDLDGPEEVDYDSDELPASPQDFVNVEPDFTVAQAQTAMALMAFADGNPSMALAYCRTLSHTTDEREFFAGVENALLSTFPPPKQQHREVPVVVMR